MTTPSPRGAARAAQSGAAPSGAPALPKVKQAHIWAVHRYAMQYWHAQLAADPGVLTYLRDVRGWPDPVAWAHRYGVGYAPGRGTRAPRLVPHLLRLSAADRTAAGLLMSDEAELRKVLLASGLAKEADEGGALRDRFVGRIMFPIAKNGSLEALWDEGTHLLGFGGRITPEAAALAAADGREPPKYLNSPETAVFHKRETLYGWSWARDAVVKRRQAIVCEGQMDLIRIRESGFPHVVACCGTALTAEHVALLAQACPVQPAVRRRQTLADVVLMTDADAAGRRAAEKGSRLVLRAGLRGRIATFGGGKDPDEMLKGADPAALAEFQAIIDAAASPVRNYLDVQADRCDGTPPWRTSLRAFVATLRNLQHRAVGSPEVVQRADAQIVADRFARDAGLPLTQHLVADLFTRVDDAAALEDDVEVGT